MCARKDNSSANTDRFTPGAGFGQADAGVTDAAKNTKSTSRFTPGASFKQADVGVSSIVSGTDTTTASVPGMDDVLNPKKKSKKISQDESVQGNLFAVDDPITQTGPNYGYDRIRLRKKDEVSIYAQQQDERNAMDPRARNCLLLIGALVVVFIVAILVPDAVYNLTHVNFSLAVWLDDLTSNAAGLLAVVSFQPYPGEMLYKVCQFIVVALAGAGLAVTGAMFQGAMKNAMAAPSTLGVMSGAQLGSVLFILFGGTSSVLTYAGSLSAWSSQYTEMDLLSYIWATCAQSFCSLAGAFVIVMLVLLISFIAGRGKVSKSGLVIAGSVFTTIISGIIQLIRYWLTTYGTDEQVTMVSSVATGSISQVWTPLQVIVLAVPVVICLFVLFRMRMRMNLLAFSDDEAHSMGLSPQASRNVTIAVCTILTAVIVAFCGGIGFVGFLVPHLTRKLVGPDFKYLVPGSMLVGALFAMVANAATNMCFDGLGMGSLTGIIGAIVFLIAMLRQRRRGDVDWI